MDTEKKMEELLKEMEQLESKKAFYISLQNQAVGACDVDSKKKLDDKIAKVEQQQTVLKKAMNEYRK